MKYSPEIVQEILKLLEAGNYITTACQAVGIHPDTYYDWLKDETKPDISDKIIQRAESRAIARNVAIIQQAALKNWTAAAWFLERKNFREWGRKDQLEVEDKSPRTINFVFDGDNGNGNGSKRENNDSFPLVITEQKQD